MEDLVWDRLAQFPEIKHYHVAFSGGLDSCVLLYCMAQLRAQSRVHSFSALHVHHGLSDDADDWDQHCQMLCEQLDIPYQLLKVNAHAENGEGPEAAARNARYLALADFIGHEDALLTAHHQNDQAETLLLQLMRGSGVPGLAAMPVSGHFSKGLLLRPLLDVSRAQLKAYALKNELDWVEDSSNEDTRFDRNYMRHEIVPRLLTRWPGALNNVARTARHMADATGLVDDLACIDLGQCLHASRLSVIELKGLSEPRQRNVLRYWFRQQSLAVPTDRQMQHIINDVLEAREDATPCVRWADVELRRYQQFLYVMHALTDHDTNQRIEWDLSNSLTIAGSGSVSVQSCSEKGLNASLYKAENLTIRFRQGGERLIPAGRRHHHELKSLLQEAHIPPWERDRIPLLYQQDELIAVANVCICEGWQAEAGQQGLCVEWTPE